MPLVGGVDLPAPVALAKLVDTLTPPGPRNPVWEPKWDGYRALYGGGRLYSRRGTDLGKLFPDLLPVLAAQIPADVVLDGELVTWNTATGRLDFNALQARMTAGRSIRAVAAEQPAHFVAFDVLADGHDLRGRPLRERRQVLERILSTTSSPIELCQQTADLTVAQDWFGSLTAAGIEGLVIKDASSGYPTREGQRVWFKTKARATVEMVAIGFTGTTKVPTTLVLAFPGAVDEDGTPVTAGSTTVLNAATAKAVAPLLTPTGPTFERVFAWGARRPTTVHVVEPLVVEVSADAAASAGVLRHAARLLRARPDLTVEDVTASG